MRGFSTAILISSVYFTAHHASFAAPPLTNLAVLKAAQAIADGGGYNSRFAGSGTPAEIRFKGVRILSAAMGGTYCNGFTFAVVMDVGQNSAPQSLKDKTVDQVKLFQQQWYGVSEVSKEKQCVTALETLGVGKEVPHNQAEPGDFIQFWRGASGHSAVFVDWVKDGEKLIGLRYRSSQGATKGVGDNTEYFSDVSGKKGAVDRKRTYFGRLSCPAP